MGIVTRQIVLNASGKALTSADMKQVPGAEDVVPFNEANWGEITRQYVKSTYSLKDKSWDAIFEKAEQFTQDKGKGKRSRVTDSLFGERAQFQDLSDDECK